MMVLGEAAIVGISVVLMGTLVSFLLGPMMKVDLPPVCNDWNKNFVMEISLVPTGFLLHLLFEYTGLNKWYCEKGYACNRLA